MEELQAILKSLNNLSVGDLMILNSHLAQRLYAKGVEDFIRAKQFDVDAFNTKLNK